MEVWQDIPAWLKSIGYQNPFDPNKTALHRAWNYDKSFFEFLPEKGFLDQFQAFMSLYRVDRAEFLDIFPAQERLIAGSKEDGTILVDVGGGRGHGSSPYIDDRWRWTSLSRMLTCNLRCREIHRELPAN